MAKRWNPDDIIGNNEHIGRRLFDEPMLAGAINQRQWSGIKVNHFQESRDREYSLDRLGASSIDPRVVRYVAARAERHALTRTGTNRFDGWVYVKAKDLVPFFDLHASGINGDENDLDANLYHAHVLRPEDVSDELMAFRLREKFCRGDVEMPPKRSQKPNVAQLADVTAQDDTKEQTGSAENPAKKSPLVSGPIEPEQAAHAKRPSLFRVMLALLQRVWGS